MVRPILLLAALFLVVLSAVLLIIRAGPTRPVLADLFADHRRTEAAEDPRSESDFGRELTPEPLRLPQTGEPGAENPVQPELPAARLAVEVVYREGANPVPGAYVRVTSTDSITRALLSDMTDRTDHAGVCQVTSSLGTVNVVVWTEAHEYGQGFLQHNGGVELERIRIEVERLASVSGVVRGPEGQPIEGVRVGSLISQAIGAPAVTTDSEGRFVFHDWPRGPIAVLSFDADGYGQEGVTLVVDDARWCVLGMSDEYDWRQGTPFIEVVLTPEGMIRGALVGSEGHPLVGGRVRATGVVASSSRILLGDEAEAVTDSDGMFELRGLRLDVPHLVLCDAPGEGIAVRAAASSTAGSIDLGMITLCGSGRVTGRFVDPWERPISGAPLELSLPAITSLVPGGVAPSVMYGSPSRLVSSSQVSSDGHFAVSGPSVSGLQLTVRLGFRTLWEGHIDLSAGDVDLGTVRIETEIQLVTGHLLTPDAEPARLDILSSHGSLWARVESASDGAFQFVTLDGAPESVTLVQRSEDSLPIHRWVRDTESFPLTLQGK